MQATAKKGIIKIQPICGWNIWVEIESLFGKLLIYADQVAGGKLDSIIEI